LLLAPEPCGNDEWTHHTYSPWWTDVRNVALSRTDPQPRKADRALPLMVTILAAPDPRKYEQSPIGDGALRRDMLVWQDAALLAVQEAGK